MTPTILLALMVCAEASGEPLPGQIAVAQVALERVGDDRWPDTVAAVVSEPRQFSVAAPRWETLTHPVFARCLRAAWVAERIGGIGATHFHNGREKPAWALRREPLYRVGRHVFYE